MKKQFHVAKNMGELKKWFWKLVAAMTNKERQELLRFMSGSCSLQPKTTYYVSKWNNYDGDSDTESTKFKNAKTSHLPHGTTCSNAMTMPEYSNYNTFKDKVMMAITCSLEFDQDEMNS